MELHSNGMANEPKIPLRIPR